MKLPDTPKRLHRGRDLDTDQNPEEGLHIALNFKTSEPDIDQEIYYRLPQLLHIFASLQDIIVVGYNSKVWSKEQFLRILRKNSHKPPGQAHNLLIGPYIMQNGSLVRKPERKATEILFWTEEQFKVISERAHST